MDDMSTTRVPLVTDGQLGLLREENCRGVSTIAIRHQIMKTNMSDTHIVQVEYVTRFIMVLISFLVSTGINIFRRPCTSP